MDKIRNNLIEMYIERMRVALKSPKELKNRTEGREISEIVGTFELIVDGIETGRIYDLHHDFGRGMLRRGTYEVTARKYETFGEAIRDFREQSELSIQSLAEIAKVSSRTIVCIENNRSRGRKLRRGVRDRLMKSFRIKPPERQDEIYNLPVKVKNE